MAAAAFRGGVDGRSHSSSSIPTLVPFYGIQLRCQFGQFSFEGLHTQPGALQHRRLGVKLCPWHHIQFRERRLRQGSGIFVQLSQYRVVGPQ